MLDIMLFMHYDGGNRHVYLKATAQRESAGPAHHDKLGGNKKCLDG
jgi:hypothetical protein